MTNKFNNRPHEPRGNWLKNGNSPGDPATAPRCLAKTRRSTLCQAPALKGRTRCRLHGGHSTGPKTPEGIDRCRQSKIKHGYYSAEAKIERMRMRKFLDEAKSITKAFFRKEK